MGAELPRWLLGTSPARTGAMWVISAISPRDRLGDSAMWLPRLSPPALEQRALPSYETLHNTVDFLQDEKAPEHALLSSSGGPNVASTSAPTAELIASIDLFSQADERTLALLS